MVDEMLVFGASSQPTDSGEQKIVLAGMRAVLRPIPLIGDGDMHYNL